MKNNRTANQEKNARAAYRALVAARTIGRSLADLGSCEATRAAVTTTREEARLELELAGHYPNEVYNDDQTTWRSESGNEPELVCELIDGEWVTERFLINLRSNLGEFVSFEYKAEFHRGHIRDRELQYISSIYAEDDERKRVDAPSTSKAWLAARHKAQLIAGKYFMNRATALS